MPSASAAPEIVAVRGPAPVQTRSTTVATVSPNASATVIVRFAGLVSR